MTEKNVLKDIDLEGVTGGIIFNASRISGADPQHPYEVLDDRNGNVLARGATYEEARALLDGINRSLPADRQISCEYTEDWNRIVALRGK